MWQRLAQGSEIAFQSLADRLGMPTQPLGEPLAAALCQISVERLEAVERRYRHHEVPTRKADEPLDLPLVVALARTPELILEQVV